MAVNATLRAVMRSSRRRDREVFLDQGFDDLLARERIALGRASEGEGRNRGMIAFDESVAS